MASKFIIFSAAFLVLVSVVAGRALEEVELGVVRDPNLVPGVQRVRNVPAILVPVSQLPYGGSGVGGGERNPNPYVVQRPAREGLLVGSGYPQPHLVQGSNSGLGRSELSSLPVGGNRPLTELPSYRQYQSGVQPLQLNSADNQGYVPLPFYPGNVPLNPVNPINYGYNYNNGYIPYYYTYVAGYAPQPIVV